MTVVTAILGTVSPDKPITLDGIGPIRVGSSLAAASRAAGEALVEVADPPSGNEACYLARLRSLPGVHFMVADGRVVRVQTDDRRFRTASGVRVGDSEATVRRIYGTQLEITGHQYIDGGRYLIVRSRDRRRALVIETDGKNVVEIRAGLEPAAEYVEDCL